MHIQSTGRIQASTPHHSLRRLSVKLILIVLAKIAFLSLIWWYLAAHYPRPDTRPTAIEHLLAPSPSTTPEAKP